MNWEHLKTYIWLRWRLSANQVRRSGTIGAIIGAILAALRILGGIITFIAGLLVGVFALRHAEPKVVMVVWDVFAAGFLFFWLIGLMSELQRTELLSLDNFMHLPVSPTGAFFINYVGSSIGLSLILFLPAMIGLGIGLTVSRGPAMLLLFPLIVSFFPDDNRRYLSVPGMARQHDDQPQAPANDHRRRHHCSSSWYFRFPIF